MIQALRVLRERNDILALVAIFLATFFFPGGVPAGIRTLGIVAGAGIALNAIGLVLVYRSNRIINFAQVQIGVVAATLFVTLIQYAPLLRGLRAVCPPCLDTVTPGVFRANYYIALVLSLLASMLIAYLLYTFIIKRFSNAPRLVLTVVTIFVVQLLGGIQGLIPQLLSTEEQREIGIQLGAVGPPFEWTIEVAPATFHTADILTVILSVLAVGGILVWLRYSSTGVAIRASAENPDRSATLGVNVDRVTSRVWVLSGLLSGIAGILVAMTVGATGAGISVRTMVQMLAVAVIARMVGLAMTAAAAVVFGILQQSVQWAFGTTEVLDGLFVLLIGAILLLQRYRASRAEIAQASAWKADREIRPIPRELRDLPSVRTWLRAGAVVTAIVLAAYPWAMSPRQTNLAGVFVVYAMVGLSLLVLTGWAGQISLGQFAFAAVGGYATAAWGLPAPVALIVAGLVGAVTATVLGIPALKLRGLHLAIITLAFSLSTTAILLNPRRLGEALPDTLRRPVLLGMDFEDDRVFYYFALVMLALVLTAVIGLRRSRTARALIAARDNEQAAQSFGINLVRARLGAFAISGFIAAFAGGLFAYHQFGVNASAYAPEQSITMFVMAVIGGFGHWSGPLIGALYFWIVTIVSSDLRVQFISVGLMGLFVLLMAPGGLGQLAFDMRDSILRRVAKRHRIVVPSLLADVRTEGLAAERVGIAPRTRTAGAYVPDRYRIDGQWALGLGDDTVRYAHQRTAIADGGSDEDEGTFGTASAETEEASG